MGSGLVPLRPLTIGEIYDGAIRAIRANPGALAGFAAAAVAVFSLLTLLPQALALSRLAGTGVFSENFLNTVDQGDINELLASVSLLSGLTGLVFLLATAMVSTLAAVAVDAAVRGSGESQSALIGRARARMLPAIGLMFVIVIAMPLVVVVCLLPGIVVEAASPGSTGAGLLVALGVIAALVLVPALVLSRWAVAVPVLALEQRGVIASLRRANQLAKGNGWRIFGITLLSWIIVSVLWRVFQVPFNFAAGLVGPQLGSGTFGQTVVQLLIINVSTILAGAILLPFVAGVAALLHLDLRMRREGLDVDLMRPGRPR